MAAIRVRAWAPASIAFPLGFLYLFFAIFQPLKPFDEGLILTGAERILHGAIPYRDFAAYYAPGQFYTLAAVFRVFGSSILVERVWDTVVRFLVCVMAFLIARTLTRQKTAYLPFLITLLFLGWCGFYGYPVVPAMFWALTSAFLLIRNWPDNRPKWLFLAGLAAGLSASYRQDVGAYALASGAMTLLIARAAGREGGASRPGGVVEGLKPLVWYGVGTCSVVLPLVAYLLWKIPLNQLWADFLTLPRLQVQFRHLPLPPLIPGWRYLLSSAWLERVWFLFYVPVGIYAITAMKLVGRISRPVEEPEARRQRFAQGILTLFGILLFVTAVTRADPAHCLAPAIPAAILLVPILLEWPRRRKWGNLSLAVCLVILAVPYVASPLARWGLDLYLCAPWGTTSSLPRARFFRVAADQEAAVRFVQQHVPPSEVIFVGNAQHSSFFGNDAMFYFLAERQPGTRYEEFEPGVVTTDSVQRGIVRELQENQVRWIVLFSGFQHEEGEAPTVQNGAATLDDFLRAQYHTVDTSGRYTMQRVGGTSAG